MDPEWLGIRVEERNKIVLCLQSLQSIWKLSEEHGGTSVEEDSLAVAEKQPAWAVSHIVPHFVF